MKVICLGGLLIGFTRNSNAAKAADLAGINIDEPIVLVCHGAPYEKQDNTGEKRIPTQLLERNLHALVIAHRDHGASSPQLNDVKEKLAQRCRRVFGMTRGWDLIQAPQRSKLIAFLESDEIVPTDPDTQSLLGYDSPVCKLALRVALEIALRELDGRSTEKSPAVDILLSPALTIAEREPSLAQSVRGIRQALTADRETIQQEVNRALVELRS